MPQEMNITYQLDIDVITAEPFALSERLTQAWASVGVHLCWNVIPAACAPAVEIIEDSIRSETAWSHPRKGALQVICCRTLHRDGVPADSVLIGEDGDFESDWHNTLFVTAIDLDVIGTALAQLVLGRTATQEQSGRSGRLCTDGTLTMSLTEQLLARDRILFDLQGPPKQAKGRILWVFANPYIDLIAGPYGLDILDGIAKRHGFQTHFVNPYLESLDPQAGLLEAIRRTRPDLIGVSFRNIDDALIVHRLEGDPQSIDTHDLVGGVTQLLQVLGQFDGPVIVGGAAFGTAPERFLHQFQLDYGIIGAADRAIDQLCADWSPLERSGEWRAGFERVWSTLPGAVWRTGDTFARREGSRTRELQQTPRIRRTLPYTLLNKRDWLPEPVRGAQGCALGCSYCVESVNRKQMSWRQVGEVVDEMEFAMRHYGLQVFHLADSEANVPFSRLTDLADEIVRRGLDGHLLWTAYLNVKPFDTAAIPLLSRSGLYRFKFALDHFHDSMLKSYHKNFREDDIAQLLDGFAPYLRQTQFYAGVLLGGPGESEETLACAVQRMKEEAARGFTFYYNVGVRVYPGTPFAEQWQRAADPTHYYGPGLHDGAVSPLVYCAPQAPRPLAARLESVFADTPRVFRMNQEKILEIGYEGYRRYLIAWHAWLAGRESEAAAILDQIENLHVLRQGMALRRLLRLRSRRSPYTAQSTEK